MAPNGDTMIVWHQYDGDANAVFLSEYRNNVWSHPSGLTDNITLDGVDCESPQVALSNTDVAIVFVRPYGSYDNVYMTDLRSNTWRPAKRITPIFTDAWTPTVAMNASGRALAVWPAWTNTTGRIYRSYYR